MALLAVLGGTPVLNKLLTPYSSMGAEEVEAVNNVARSGRLSSFIGAWCADFDGGHEIRAFEREWAERFDCRHAITVNSNTSGLIAALGAVGVSPGDEVIVPPYSMSATVMAPLFYGGIPVFVDIEPKTFCLDPALVRASITSKTRAIIAVNLFGHPAALHELRALADEHGIYLIEDAAQSPLASENGRMTGTIGHIGVFSLNYHKHIHTGEGGMCCTDDDALSLRMRMIRNHGENVIEPLHVEDITNLVGFNFRMTELSAAIGREQLRKADTLVSGRQAIAERLTAATQGLPGLTPPMVRQDCRHVYYVWCARHDAAVAGVSRATVVRALVAEGVPLSEGYVKPLYMLPAFQRRIAIGRNGWPFTLSERRYDKGLCPVVERMDEHELVEFCTCSHALPEEELACVIEAFQKVYSQLDVLADMEKKRL
ncbi:MAG: DegT/DnrJ/EryC1/StrS family aminotransferase [Gallionella sp.]|nr:DegT/DnrJ/EryC1/StrS family aminotransferase [Gallionella sp.]